jgi:hypothetical protein
MREKRSAQRRSRRNGERNDTPVCAGWGTGAGQLILLRLAIVRASVGQVAANASTSHAVRPASQGLPLELIRRITPLSFIIDYPDEPDPQTMKS